MAAAGVVQLVAIIVGCAVTIGTIVYKFGALEGRLLTKLEDHDRRLTVLEGERRYYVRRAEDHP